MEILSELRRKVEVMATTVVMVKRIITDWDCRRIRALQAVGDRNKLKGREVVLAFNKALTMARVVDSRGSFLTVYADYGHVFDVETLLDANEESFGISLRLSRMGKVVPFKSRHKEAA